MENDRFGRRAEPCPRSDELRLDTCGSPEACASIVVAAVEQPGFARRGATRSYLSVVGQFPSAKMAATFPMESNVEASVLTLADVLEHVAAYRPQAVRVVFHHGDRCVVAYPDVAVIRTDGAVELWECKSNGRLREETVDRMKALKAALRAVGIGYVLRRPSWSRRAPLAGNAASIWRHADAPLSASAFADARAAVRSGVTTFGELGLRLGAPTTTLLALAARGAFAVDIGGAPLGADSLVREAIPGATSGAFDATAVGSTARTRLP